MSQEWNQPGEGSTQPSQQPSSGYQQPASTYNAPTSGNTPPSKPNRTWIYIAVIAVLLGVNGYLFFNRRQLMSQNTVVVHERDSVSTSRDALQKDYDASIARLDDLTSKNTSLNNQINDQNGEIASLRNQINTIMKDKNASAAQLKKARELINKLNNKVAGYEAEIVRLQGENKNLTNQNQNLSQDVSTARTKNDSLQKVVKLGAVLHASNIRMTAINLKHHGEKEKETGKARKADLLRIVFDIDENRVAESGPNELYLRITGPNGNLLSNAAFGSGSTTDANGASVNYTLVKEIQLTQGQPVSNVTIDWKQQSDYEKGTYAIEIYNGGYRIGSGNVTLH